MKIFVAGNCQARSIGRCLVTMYPDSRIEVLPGDVDPIQFAARDDLVFRQRHSALEWSLQPAREREFVFPMIWFNGFHPDLVFARGPTDLIPSPLAHCNSSLALYGWLHEMSISQTARLFCEAVYEKLNFFGYWDVAKRAFFEACEAAGTPLESAFGRWGSRGRFMHTVNHPILSVVADVSRELAERARLSPAVAAPEEYLPDHLIAGPIWPIYPEIGARLGLHGTYSFKVPDGAAGDAPVILDLEAFIQGSFESYARVSRDALRCERLESSLYRDLESVVRARSKSIGQTERESSDGPRAVSPYRGLPAQQYWREAVAGVACGDVDPVGDRVYPIGVLTRIATAGSCFAQHVSAALERNGYNFYVAEPATDPPAFSALYGNIYTARQLLQLYDRAYGRFEPEDRAWVRPDGRFVDPFRPTIEPAGHSSVEDVETSRADHFNAVRTMFETMDVLIFTLGLTEAWRAKSDGAIFPVAPGVAAGKMDEKRYEFCNFTSADVTADLMQFLVRLERVNPEARVLLTVSPVPLVATFESRHVLVSTTYSKAALRVAADELERWSPRVHYFPAYEIITGAHTRGRYYGPDLRSVTAEGVAHVMRTFFRHCHEGSESLPDVDAALREENRTSMELVCDEELIEASARQ